MSNQFDYESYFESIKPNDNISIYNRFLFAFLSVHTTWKSNVSTYETMKGTKYSSEEETAIALQKAGAGLWRARSKYIYKFTEDYFKRPKFYLKRRNESWIKYRNRLEKNILGLGLAKTSFAIELIYPNNALVTCIDVHISRLLEIDNKTLTNKVYHAAEERFLSLAKKNKMKPTHYRWKYWDDLQGYKNCRYWSYCLETETNDLRS